MIKLEDINKQKHIHRIYISDDKFHLESYPIVYCNKTYLYYKACGSDILRYRKWEDIKYFNEVEFKPGLFSYKYWNSLFCGTVEQAKDVLKRMPDISNEVYDLKKKGTIAHARSMYRTYLLARDKAIACGATEEEIINGADFNTIENNL